MKMMKYVIPSEARQPTTEGKPSAVGNAGRSPRVHPGLDTGQSRIEFGIPRRSAPRDDGLRMKRALILVLLVTGLSSTVRALPFEGVADFRIQTNVEKGKALLGTGKFFVTPSAYRTEFEMTVPESARTRRAGPQRMKMTMLGKVSKPDVLYMVDDENKTYSVWDTTQAAAGNMPKDTYTVERLGSGSAAGIACERALVTSSKGDRFEVCMSRELGASADWISAMSRRERAGNWIRALKEKGLEGFPIRWSMFRKDETEPFMTMELTHLEKKSLPASLFDVPAGYKQTDAAIGGLTPEQRKAMDDARERMLEKMTPEQRKAYEDAIRRSAPPTPKP
jgi:hypothetical protein